MKILFTSLAMFGVVMITMATDVKLKITYKGDGVKGHTVFVKLGDAVLGTGVTDNNGEVTVGVSSLPSNRIDLRGEKKCEGAEKSWDVKGYVALDNDNYYHLKMEDVISEMVEASGGFMSEGMLVGSYGLVCAGGGSNNSGNSSAASSNNGSSDDDDDDSYNSPATAQAPELPSREESLENQKAMLENKISNIDNKISNKQGKIEKGKFTGDKQVSAEQDMEELKIEKKITQNKLDKVNAQISNGMLSKSERQAFKAKEKELKNELSELKAAHKNGSSSTTADKVEEEKNGKTENSDTDETEEVEIATMTADEAAKMSMIQLKKYKINSKSRLSNINIQLKTRKAMMTPEEKENLEQEKKSLKEGIEIVNTEIQVRKEEK